MLTTQEYTALYHHMYYEALGGKDNVPASFHTFLARMSEAYDEALEQDEAMKLLSTAYQDILKQCDGTLVRTLAYLRAHHPNNYRDTLEQMILMGGHCDCEVVINISPDDYEERKDDDINPFGNWEWKQIVERHIRKATRHKKPSANQSELW
jgi:hypothetical protein